MIIHYRCHRRRFNSCGKPLPPHYRCCGRGYLSPLVFLSAGPRPAKPLPLLRRAVDSRGGPVTIIGRRGHWLLPLLLATVTVTVITAIIGGCLLLATTAAGVIRVIVRCS